MGDRRRVLLLYLRAHHGIGVLVGFAVIAALDIVCGSAVLNLPILGTTSTGFPLRRNLPVGFVAIAVGSLASRMAGAEECAAGVQRTWERWHAAIVSVVCVATAGLTELAASDGRLALILMRATLFWLGLAFLSGRTLGRRHAWIVPVASIFPASYLAQTETGDDAWWDWTGQPPGSGACLALAVAVFAAGVIAFETTPWRIAAGRRPRASRPSSAAARGPSGRNLT